MRRLRFFPRSPSSWQTRFPTALAECDRVPSSNELAAYYRLNPATAAKAINASTNEGLLEKRCGIGMFVAGGARQRLPDERRKRLTER